MDRFGSIKLLALFSFLFLASGCAHIVSSEMRQRAREDLPFTTVLHSPDAYKGETIIWGGRIIETLNRDKDTFIKVLQIPLDSYGEPEDEIKTRGRFIIKYSGYADKEIYREGRMITVAGVVIGKEVQRLDELEYTYPLILAKEVHLWRPYPRYYGHPYWYSYPYPYYGPYFHYRFFFWP